MLRLCSRVVSFIFCKETKNTLACVQKVKDADFKTGDVGACVMFCERLDKPESHSMSIILTTITFLTPCFIIFNYSLQSLCIKSSACRHLYSKHQRIVYASHTLQTLFFTQICFLNKPAIIHRPSISSIHTTATRNMY